MSEFIDLVLVLVVSIATLTLMGWVALWLERR